MMNMDPLLYGTDTEENIIAGYQIDNKHIRIYKKSDKEIKFDDKEFYPFFFISNPALIKDFPRKFWLKKLNGKNHFQHLCVFYNWDDLKEAYNFTINSYKKEEKGDVKDTAVVLLKNDPVGQYLMQYGKTLFKGMNFKDLYRIRFDIYMKQSDGEEKKISAIYLSDNKGWEHIIYDRNKSEEKIIEEFIKIINTKDPDVIEGYNLYGFIFPLLLNKCKKYNIPLKIGRNEFEIKYLEKIALNEYGFESAKLVIPGRHLVDILDLVQSFDNIKKTVEINSLENIAKALGDSKEKRVTLKEIEFSEHEKQAGLIKQHLSDNCNDIRNISDVLLPVVFNFSQMVPYNLNRVVKLNNSAKIESLFIREYLKQRHSLPLPAKLDLPRGSNIEIFYTGVIGPIIHVSLEMLYPIILIKNGICPGSDELGVFYKTLNSLYEQYKVSSFSSLQDKSETEKKHLLDLEHSFKILINTFFTCLSSPWFMFNSSEKSKEVIQLVKEVFDKITKTIKNSGGIPVEIDPEEICFVPPRDVLGEEAEKNFISSLNKKLSDLASTEFKSRFRRMLSYNKKNHAFLGYNNKIVIKGSSLIAKNIERFGRKFIFQCIDLLLNNRIEELHQLYNKYYKDILDKKLDVLDFQRTDTLRESLWEYEESVKRGERNRLPYYQLAIASGKKFKTGDLISYYIITDEAAAKRNKVDYETVDFVKSISVDSAEGAVKNHIESVIQSKDIQSPYFGCENYKISEEWNPNFRDENISHYLKRLDEIAEKFAVYFTPEDFKMIFSPDDLFIYSSPHIKVLTREVIADDKEHDVSKF